jgi:hypothetical protein
MPNGWTVTQQIPYDELRNGNFVPGKMVYYQIDGSSTTGRVFIPQSLYNYDYVVQVIDAIVAEEKKVEGLA